MFEIVNEFGSSNKLLKPEQFWDNMNNYLKHRKNLKLKISIFIYNEQIY